MTKLPDVAMPKNDEIERKVTFLSDGLRLAGVMRIPPNMSPGERRPAFIVLHGFGSNKEAGNVLRPVEMLSGLGYVALRFDMRGCGNSAGEPGRLICMEQVADTQRALEFMQSQPEVISEKIGLLGSSFGAAVALYTAGIDNRVSAVISAGGWGNGERKFRGQHPEPAAWNRFVRMLEDGREQLATTGRSALVSRYDIVPIPPHLRGHLSRGSVQQFPVETAQSMFDFRAEDVVNRIAPRPLLLLHSSVDAVTPMEQSIALYQRAGQPTDLHLFAQTDHFLFDENSHRVRRVVGDWLNDFFPLDMARQIDSATYERSAIGP